MVRVTPASGSVGAHIEGVDLAGPLDEAIRSLLVDAWHEHGVLFFPDQHLDSTQQLAAASIFGEPTPFDFAPPASTDEPLVHVIAEEAGRRHGGISTWHTDATWLPEPPRGSMLAAISLPPLGGDTLFASGAMAYENLSAPMQRLADGLTASHEGGAALTRAARKVGVDIPAEPVVHPVVRRHPVTGAKTLFVNGLFTSRILELSPRESDALLRLFYDQFRDPEVQCRFHWAEGDVAVWDNRAVQHYASPDYDEPRRMHRVVLAGDRVAGVG